MTKGTLETILEFMYKYKIKLGRRWLNRKLDILNDDYDPSER